MGTTKIKNGLLATLFIGPIFAVVGYFVAFHIGKPILDNARASATWPSVDGVVERSRVATSRNSDGKTMYSAEVLYRYRVNSQQFKCDTISFGGDISSSSRRSATKVTSRYPVKKKVTVHYRPEDPAEAVLEPGVTWKSFLVFGAGLIFLVVGLLVFVGPICYLAASAIIVGGAVTGMIGKRKEPPAVKAQPKVRSAPAKPRSVAPPRHDGDDGFDIG